MYSPHYLKYFDGWCWTALIFLLNIHVAWHELQMRDIRTNVLIKLKLGLENIDVWLLIAVSHHKTSVFVNFNIIALAAVKKDVCNQLNWLLQTKMNAMHVLFYLSLPWLHQWWYWIIVGFTNLYCANSNFDQPSHMVSQVKSSRVMAECSRVK